MEERLKKLEQTVEELQKRIGMASKTAADLSITVGALENRTMELAASLKNITNGASANEEPKEVAE